MEIMTNGRRTETRFEPSPARPMFLSFTRRARTMGRPSGLLRPRRAQGMAFGEVLRHDLVDLRFCVRFESDVDRFEDSASLHDDMEATRRLRVTKDLFEVTDRGLKRGMSVDSHQSIARSKVGAFRRSVRNHRLDFQARIQLNQLHAQVPATGKHLTNVLL